MRYNVTTKGLALRSDFIRKGVALPDHVKILSLIMMFDVYSGADADAPLAKSDIANWEAHLKYLLDNGFLEIKKEV